MLDDMRIPLATSAAELSDAAREVNRRPGRHSLSGAAGFATDYLGVLPLAKSYGTGPLYRLRRSDEAE